MVAFDPHVFSCNEKKKEAARSIFIEKVSSVSI